MIGFHPQSRRKIAFKNYKSLGELYRNTHYLRRKNSQKLFHVMLFWMFLFLSARIGFVMPFFSQFSVELPVKLPQANFSETVHSTSTYILSIDKRANIVLSSGACGYNIHSLSDLKTKMILMNKSKPINQINLKIDADLNMFYVYGVLKKLSEIKKLNFPDISIYYVTASQNQKLDKVEYINTPLPDEPSFK